MSPYTPPPPPRPLASTWPREYSTQVWPISPYHTIELSTPRELTQQEAQVFRDMVELYLKVATDD